VSAFFLCQPGSGATLCAAECPKPRFNGFAVDVAREGAWALALPRAGELYRLNAPSLCLRLLPVPGAEWAGAVRLACAASGVDAKLAFHPRVLPGTQQHTVSGSVKYGCCARTCGARAARACTLTHRSAVAQDGHGRDAAHAARTLDTGGARQERAKRRGAHPL
jgi:hypothetical protein